MKHVSFRSWLRTFIPGRFAVDAKERWRAVGGAGLGILCTAFLSHWLGGHTTPWLVAPLGASAVLVFAAPASPLAQPWSVVGGNTLSALLAVLCVRLIGVPELAAAVAVASAIALMFALRCLHPPGGAAALLVALGGVSDPRFALFPVLLNSVLLVTAGLLWNNATGRPYPHLQVVPIAPAPAPKPDIDSELEAVLTRYNQVLDVSRDDLKALLESLRVQLYERRLSNTSCREVMSAPVITVAPSTTRAEALAVLGAHHVKAIPVVVPPHQVVGIVTPTDFVRAPAASTVGEFMTPQVQLARTTQRLSELVPLFQATGHHHLPVVDEHDVLVGILTQADVMAALSPRP